MKIQLAEKFRLATPETLTETIKIVESTNKSFIDKHGSKFLQIKLDNMDKALFDKISSLIDDQPKCKKVKIID